MYTTNLRKVTLDQIANLPVHPVADLFPMLSEDTVTEAKRPEGMTLRELAESIRDNGLQEPIVLIESVDQDGKPVTMLLDGRNRRQGCLRAAKMLKKPIEEFEIQIEDFVGTEEEANEFVLTLNIDRRNLTTGQRAFVAVEYWDLYAAQAEARMKAGVKADPSANLHEGRTDDTLSQRFRVSARSIAEARAHKKQLQAAQAQIEIARKDAERQAAIKIEAEAELEAAKEIGDSSKVKDAAHKANIAANAVTEAKEKIEEKAQIVSQKQAKINRVTAGKESLNSLKDASPGQTIKADDPVAKFRSSLNSAANNFRDAAKALLEGGRKEDIENVRLKVRDLWLEFGNLDPVEGLVDVSENRDRFGLAEEIASDHGTKMSGSGTAVAPHTKPCGCSFSGVDSCESCA